MSLKKCWVWKIVDPRKFGSEIFLDLNEIFSLKDFKIQKKIWVRKYYLSEKILGLKNTGPEKISGLKNFRYVKILSSKKLWIQNNSGSKKILESKIFWVWNFFVSTVLGTFVPPTFVQDIYNGVSQLILFRIYPNSKDG